MVKFIYFDVGGVVIFDFTKTTKWHELASEIGISIEKEKEFLDYWIKIEDYLCIGHDINEYILKIEQKFKIKFPKNYSIITDGFVSRFTANKSIWPVISEARKKFKIGLLTDMYKDMYKLIEDKGIYPDISWDVIVNSSSVGIRKPNIDIYNIAEERSGFKGDEILFIDNMIKNLEVARKLNWKTYLYDPLNVEKSNRELLNTISNF
jgi:FMN phosphatase YigB (HAD superfamily)